MHSSCTCERRIIGVRHHQTILCAAVCTWAVKEKTLAGSASGCHEGKAAEKNAKWDKNHNKETKKKISAFTHFKNSSSSCTPQANPKYLHRKALVCKTTLLHSAAASVGALNPLNSPAPGYEASERMGRGLCAWNEKYAWERDRRRKTTACQRLNHQSVLAMQENVQSTNVLYSSA